MKISNAVFAKDFIRVCDGGPNQNRHERSGSNLSCRIEPEEMESVEEGLSHDGK